jgi:MoaA/NifB/PqqE/SkfB family radical SAM enzyme
MNLRSLSIAVPTKGCGHNGKGCPNACKFCVSSMDDNAYPNLIDTNDIINERDYINRINFCLERNFEALILTGTGEPALNMDFLRRVAYWNKMTIRPFLWMEIQTSGVTLNEEKLQFLRNNIGVTTISLSLSCIFDSDLNSETNQTPENLRFHIDDLCNKIKEFGFNLRLSLNMWSCYDSYDPSTIFDRAKDLGANQITFRMLYTSGNKDLPQNIWIRNNPFREKIKLDSYISKKGTQLEQVSFGAMRYDVNGISTLLDQDCMSTKSMDDVRYLVLRPNCHLYTKWSSTGSILF